VCNVSDKQNMEKKLLKRFEGMEDGERDKLRELLKDSKQTYEPLPKHIGFCSVLFRQRRHRYVNVM